ncbi:hypothetical protein [Sulfurimonas sp.]|uniref:hypothetical protein n=1 Tax=Sulfurimonas sp. TaxID=2022749 RepID=UPI002AAF9928|nr:hypothetical protein [Sulfurimonas sp.]
MDKVKTIESFQNAKKAYEEQMEKLEIAMDGSDIKIPTAALQTAYVFGEWFYLKNENIRCILGSLFYDKIETLHVRWHEEFVKTFDIFFQKQKKGFFQNAFGSSKVTGMELEKAKSYHRELKGITKELIKTIDSSERRLSALAESKFS